MYLGLYACNNARFIQVILILILFGYIIRHFIRNEQQIQLQIYFQYSIPGYLKNIVRNLS